MPRAEKPLTYEQALARLQEIVGLLEKGDQPLEESLKLFEEGVALARQCSEKLDNAQGLVEKLIEARDGKITTEVVDLDELGK
jgi:exodeoxyribonuclease VII small subunit